MTLIVPPLPAAAMAEASSVASDATATWPPVTEIVPPLPALSEAASILPATLTEPLGPAVSQILPSLADTPVARITPAVLPARA